MTYESIRNHPEVLALLARGDYNVGVLGFTAHSTAHTALVAARAAYILRKLGYSEHLQELAKIAGFMHDIGNAINRKNHAEYGALLANDILKSMGMDMDDRIMVVAAIGNHDESTGGAKDPLSAALILADKTDVRRNRVRTQQPEKFDIHDRVNYAVTRSLTSYKPEKSSIVLTLEIDEEICTMYDYFEIFLERMMMCRRAAELLGVRFRLTANGQKVL